jgi:hypothetical protein
MNCVIYNPLTALASACIQAIPLDVTVRNDAKASTQTLFVFTMGNHPNM